MVVDKTLIHNPVVRQHALRIPTIQSGTPLVLQLGGSNPEELAQASKIVREGGYEYTEINLNCGCPSPKVAGKGCFGAALMREPALVAEACSRIAEHATVPVTVKCRLGVDDDDSYESLHAFVKTVSEQGGVRHFIVHARNAILGGLSPAQNRSIPPLRYHFVHRLMRDFPGLTFSINGGFKKMADIRAQLEMGVDGVMVGREVMDHPWRLLSDVDNLLYGVPRLDENGMPISRRWVLKRYLEYAEGEVGQGCSVRSVVRPVVGLFGGERNGKRFRRALDEGLSNGLAATEIVNKACTELDDETLDAVAPSMRVAVVDEFAQGCGEPVVTVGVLGAVASE